MKKLFAICIAVVLLTTSCISFTRIQPYDHGYAIGTAVYAGYVRVAQKQDKEFTDLVADLWEKVNAIKDTKTLASDVLAMTECFDKIIDTGKLTNAEKNALRQLEVMALRPVDGRLESIASEHDDAVRFLEGLRAGINAMIELDKESK